MSVPRVSIAPGVHISWLGIFGSIWSQVARIGFETLGSARSAYDVLGLPLTVAEYRTIPYGSEINALIIVKQMSPETIAAIAFGLTTTILAVVQLWAFADRRRAVATRPTEEDIDLRHCRAASGMCCPGTSLRTISSDPSFRKYGEQHYLDHLSETRS